MVLPQRTQRSQRVLLTRIPRRPQRGVAKGDALAGVRLRDTETQRGVGWSRLNHGIHGKRGREIVGLMYEDETYAIKGAY